MDELKKKLFEKRAKYALYAGGSLILAPVITFITGSIYVMAFCAFAILTLNALTPAIVTKISQMKYRALEAVIDADPIATAWELHDKEGAELKEANRRLTGQISQMEMLKIALENHKKETGREPREDQKQRLSDMEAIVQYRAASYNKAVGDHNEARRELKILEADYEFDRQCIAAGEALNMEDSWQDRFKKDRVNNALAKARADSLAQLRMSMLTQQPNTVGVHAELEKAKMPLAVEYDMNGRALVSLTRVEETVSAGK